MTIERHPRPPELSPELHWCEIHGGYAARAMNNPWCGACYELGRLDGQSGALVQSIDESTHREERQTQALEKIAATLERVTRPTVLSP